MGYQKHFIGPYLTSYDSEYEHSLEHLVDLRKLVEDTAENLTILRKKQAPVKIVSRRAAPKSTELRHG